MSRAWGVIPSSRLFLYPSSSPSALRRGLPPSLVGRASSPIVAPYPVLRNCRAASLSLSRLSLALR